jgi:hypothetical protein
MFLACRERDELFEGTTACLLGELDLAHVRWRVLVRREPAPDIIDRRGNSRLYYEGQKKE